jgi:hypothetical protein
LKNEKVKETKKVERERERCRQGLKSEVMWFNVK